MGIIEKLKSALGLGSPDSGEPSRGTEVTVEHEPTSVSSPEEPNRGDVDSSKDDQFEIEPGVPEAESESIEGEITESDIDSAPPEQEQQEEDTEGDSSAVTEINGIGPAYADRLSAAGVDTVGELMKANPEELGEQTEISPKRIQRWQEQADG